MFLDHISNIFYLIYFGTFGAFLGSFVNVVIIRMGEGKSVIFPPSSCPYCHHRLSVVDLIPVFSWFLLFGKCRYCNAPISIQYPIVEFLTAVLLAYNAHLWFSISVIKFIFIASLSVIFFVTYMLFVREEVFSPTPYLLTAFYYYVYKIFITNTNLFNLHDYMIIFISFILSIISLIYDKRYYFVSFGISFCLLTISTNVINISIVALQNFLFAFSKKTNNYILNYLSKLFLFCHFMVSIYILSKA